MYVWMSCVRYPQMHIHSQYYIHCDLKPDNVLIDVKAQVPSTLPPAPLLSSDGTGATPHPGGSGSRGTSEAGGGGGVGGMGSPSLRGGPDGGVVFIPKVSDFGLSVRVPEGASCDTPIACVARGTVGYIAPEMLPGSASSGAVSVVRGAVAAWARFCAGGQELSVCVCV